MTKEELTLEVIRRLKIAYPLAECTLDYDQAWKLLVSVRLAAQCTDARVMVVVEVSGCGFSGSSGCGRYRRNCPSVRTWKEQGQRYQCLHEDAS